MDFWGIVKGVLGLNMAQAVMSGLKDEAAERVAKGVKDKLPMLLGLSLEDERIWGQLWAQLDPEERINLTKFLNDECQDYERNSFRHVVAGIPSSEDKKISYALNFLKVMAGVIKDSGADEARRQCLAGGVIEGSPFFRGVIEKWKEAVDWFKDTGMEGVKKFILDQLGVASLSEVTPELIKKKVSDFDKKIASKIPAVERRGFFAEAFGWTTRRR